MIPTNTTSPVPSACLPRGHAVRARRPFRLATLCVLAAAALLTTPPAADAQTTPIQAPTLGGTLKKDVPYVPTSEEVVAAMLKLANVRKTDVVYDLGCGDGRIVITAAKQYGVRGVGIDIDPERIAESTKNAQEAGVADRVKFRTQNLFDADIGDASVVTLYLLPDVNRKLMPKLLADLKPGTRVVSHAFDMGDWPPEKTVEVDGSRIFLWTIPQRTAEAAAPKSGG
jgi:SAM-dependent methyltransferase